MENSTWKENLEKFKLPIGLSLVGIVLIVGGVFASGINKSKPKDSSNNFPKESMVQADKLISVDVSGAVNKPDVYKLKDGSRIEEAIAAAGGFADNANKEYISKYLNMAQKLSDGSKVYVPNIDEKGTVAEGGGASTVAGVDTEAKVNINTASQSELEALSGVGPVTATKIISGRPFQTVDDLLNKKIVSKAVFEKIKNQLVLY